MIRGLGRALAFCAALGALRAWGAGGDVNDWIKSRADAYDAYLRGTRVATPGQLWHERPLNEPVAPNFIPPNSLAPIIRAVSPSVVNISALNQSDSGSVMQGAGLHRSLGSGFIIGAEGFVITNNHVVDRAEQIRVRLADGREFLANVVGTDPSTDVALLRLDTDQKDLPIAYLGDSDRLQVGDWVVAIGNPFGLDHSVAHGMISAKERVLGIGVFDDFIQTDAQINPGNSGGPLYNMRGDVIGVNTAIITQGQGIGFAVPINMVKDLIPNLSVNGHLERGWLGVNIQEVVSDAEHHGAVVKDVYAGSPAAEAGILPGDRVTAVSGRPVESYLEMLRRVAILAPGSEAKLTLLRDGAAREVTVKLGERPAPEAVQSIQVGQSGPLGMLIRDLSGEAAANLGLPPNSGVLVSGVLPGSPAERSGIRTGDVILEVNRERVQDSRTYRDAVDRLSSQQTALVRYRRGEVIRYVSVRLD